MVNGVRLYLYSFAYRSGNVCPCRRRNSRGLGKHHRRGLQLVNFLGFFAVGVFGEAVDAEDHPRGEHMKGLTVLFVRQACLTSYCTLRSTELYRPLRGFARAVCRTALQVPYCIETCFDQPHSLRYSISQRQGNPWIRSVACRRQSPLEHPYLAL